MAKQERPKQVQPARAQTETAGRPPKPNITPVRLSGGAGGTAQPGEAAVVSARGLTKVYRIEDNRIVALKNVDLDIYRGEFVCIVGTSGSGKSTLLYLLAGIERPSKGQIRVSGKRLDLMNESELVRFRRENVGFIFQNFNLLPYFTALDNVAMPLMLRHVGKFQRKRLAARMLKTVGLEKRFKNRPLQMSGGQQQRVSIARALITQPDILFADEPTGNLDSKTGEEIIRLLSDETRKRGKTLIMVTHDIDKAKYADRVIRIMDGEITSVTKNDLKREPAFEEDKDEK